MKKLFSFVLFVILIMAVSVTAFAADSDIIASGYCGGEDDGTNLEWVLTEDGTLTISGTGKMADYGDFGETYMEDAPWKQYKDHIKSLVIEEGVTYIGGCAFYNSSFPNSSYIKGKLVIPETVARIGVGAFAYCNGLSGELVIPENVTYIGHHAFSYCKGLNGNLEIGEKVLNLAGSAFSGTGIENISVSENNIRYCSVDGILYSKDLKKLILCPGGKTGSIVIPKSVERIEADAFRACQNLTGSITFPDNIVEIWRMAFESCSIDEYYFCGDAPSGIFANGEGMPTFDYNDTIYYPANNSTWEIIDGKWNGYDTQKWYVDAIASGYCGGEGDGTNLKWALTEDGTLTIFGKGEMEKFTQIINPGSDRMDAETPWRDYSSQIKSIELSDGVTTINNFAFDNLNLTGEIVIPSSVKEIGMFCFSGNKFSGDLVIPEGVEKIGRSAFMSAGDFGTAYIPSTLIEIIDNPFRYCELEEIVVHNSNPNYCSVDGVLFSKDQTVIYQFPHTRTGEYIVPNSVSIVEECAFEKSCLSKIVINGDIEYINNVAFAHNQNNLKIIFNGKVGTINNAIIANLANAEIYFMNGAPKSVYEFNGEWGGSFSSALGKTYTIYCVDDGSWELDENGLWNGYEVTEYSGYGDINIDFTVDVKDVYLTRLIAAKLVVPTDMESSFGDVDGDGKITAIDVNFIRRFCANIITKFPVEG